MFVAAVRRHHGVMKLSHRCPKCQGGKCRVTHLRMEVYLDAGAGTLGMHDRWYEEWVCARCGYAERYQLDAAPARLEVGRVFEAPGGEAPYR